MLALMEDKVMANQSDPSYTKGHSVQVIISWNKELASPDVSHFINLGIRTEFHKARGRPVTKHQYPSRKRGVSRERNKRLLAQEVGSKVCCFALPAEGNPCTGTQASYMDTMDFSGV